MYPNQDQRHSQQRQPGQQTGFTQADYMLDPDLAAMYQQPGLSPAPQQIHRSHGQPASPERSYPLTPESSSPTSIRSFRPAGAYDYYPQPSGSSGHRTPSHPSPEHMYMEPPVRLRRYQPSPSTSRNIISTPPTLRRQLSEHSLTSSEGDVLTDDPPAPDATEEEKNAYRRKKNTLAARRSRTRKNIRLQTLEEQVEVLNHEVEMWRIRAQTLGQIAVSKGIFRPDWLD